MDEEHRMIIPRWLARWLGIKDDDKRFLIVDFAGWEYKGETSPQQKGIRR